MQFGKAILAGIILWAVMFALASILMALGLETGSIIFMVIMWVLLLIAIWLIIVYWYKPKDIADAFVAGLIWLIIAALLDYFVLIRYFMADQDPATYYVWSVWVYYAVTLLWPPIIKAISK